MLYRLPTMLSREESERSRTYKAQRRAKSDSVGVMANGWTRCIYYNILRNARLGVGFLVGGSVR